jgi:hypothetical protein
LPTQPEPPLLPFPLTFHNGDLAINWQIHKPETSTPWARTFAYQAEDLWHGDLIFAGGSRLLLQPDLLLPPLSIFPYICQHAPLFVKTAAR